MPIKSLLRGMLTRGMLNICEITCVTIRTMTAATGNVHIAYTGGRGGGGVRVLTNQISHLRALIW